MQEYHTKMTCSMMILCSALIILLYIISKWNSNIKQIRIHNKMTT